MYFIVYKIGFAHIGPPLSGVPIQGRGCLTSKTPFPADRLTHRLRFVYRVTQFNVKINSDSTESEHEILSFADQNPGYIYEVPSSPDPTFGMADMSDSSLESFFSRPLKIQSFSWGTGTNIFEVFNPWTNFWENPRVVNRITNYNLLRCKMHVKIVLNGNGFHYGRAIASYLPLHTRDAFTKDRAFFIEDVVAASQRPHIYLDPTKSQGGTLVLPFVFPENAMDIPDEDWRTMGEMTIHGLQNLKHANGATDAVTVSVFAWATDVVMSTPTANEPGALTPQAGALDEYGSNPVSGPAGVVARAAGALRSIPYIAPYARATELAANAVGGIAKLFGYSRPAILTDIVPYRPTYMGNLANTNMPDSTTKLTFDPKQELTIDTRTFGLNGDDEMAISTIAVRESFLTQFGWGTAETAENLLWNCEVNPVVWNQQTIGAAEEFHMPACCFAALPFNRWRGKMKYRFQIVASAYHKGRLKITYDPSYPLSNEYNTNYTRIIDLAEERDFTVEIGWGQQFPYCTHRDMMDAVVPIYSTAPLGADPGEAANGIISVYVVNELTVPNSTVNNDIEVNVLVSCEDLELADPTDEFIKNISWFAPQAGEYQAQGGVLSDLPCPSLTCKCQCCTFEDDEIIKPEPTPQAGELGESPDGDNTTEESAPLQMEADTTLAAEVSSTDNTSHVFYGDPITSVRQVLKRYNYSITLVPIANDLGNQVHQWILSNLPMYRGYAPGAVHLTDTPALGTAYNYSKMTMINYYLPAYTCWRGSLRWKYHLLQDNSTTTSHMSAYRDPNPAFAYGQGSVQLLNETTSVSERTARWLLTAPNLFSGAHVTAASMNPVLEVELPFYSSRRFANAKQANVTGLNIGTDTLMHRLDAKLNYAANSFDCINTYCSVGEDFTLGLFTGAPVAYRQTDPGASAP